MPTQALVVGASSDIGRAIAVQLAELGHDVVLWGRDLARLSAAVEECTAAGARTWVDTLDVTQRAAVTARLGSIATRGPLSVVVYAAGVFDWAAADQADAAAWEQVLTVNLTAAACLTPLVLPQLIQAAPSTLVYIGSGASRQVFANNAAYVASKHGLAGLAGATFLDVRDRGVKVSLVSPGLVAAGAGAYSEAGRERPETLLTADDVAAAVRFVVTFPDSGCPTEITLAPQRTP
jgi:NADP-dependent 3-hydroxy acid dehydrogenase YdfG